MTGEDLEYVKRILQANLLKGPVLELGVGYEGTTCRKLIQSAGLAYCGTDVAPADGVDITANFECADEMEAFRHLLPFGSLLILNVLEHTFDPIRILDNALKLTSSGSHLVTITPAIWPLHSYPMDVWRPLPDFYIEYARRRKLTILYEYFEYIGIGNLSKFQDGNNGYQFPPPTNDKHVQSFGRTVHKVLNTFGRGMFFPSHIAIGVVFCVP